MRQYNAIHVLKFVCAIFIVAIHTISQESNIGYFIVVTSRIAVPIYCMATGYFLEEKIHTRKLGAIHKYALKIFKTYCIWSIVYVVFVNWRYFYHPSIFVSFKELLKKFIFEGTHYHLWYLISSCVAVYVVYFMSNKLGLLLSLVISFVLYLWSLLADSYYGVLATDLELKQFIDIYIKFFGDVWNSHIWIMIFIVFGIVVKKYYIQLIERIKAIYILIVYLLFVAEHFALWKTDICIDNNTSLCLLLLAPMVFIYALKIEDNISRHINPTMSIWLKDIGFAIYLIHPLFVRYLERFLGFEKSYVMFIVVLILSLGFSFLYTKRIVSKWNGNMPQPQGATNTC